MKSDNIFADLLPPAMRVVETRIELEEGPYYPEEERYIADAVPERQREFRTVRVCARRAFRELGHEGAALVPDEKRAPIWPAGVAGSMTHCAGFRAAAVASTNDIRGVGIDAELHVPLPEEILDIILLPEERPMVEDLSARYPHIFWERLIFSAKESVFKAWFPLTRQWLDFLECRILIDAPARRFQDRAQALLVQPPGLVLDLVQQFRVAFHALPVVAGRSAGVGLCSGLQDVHEGARRRRQGSGGELGWVDWCIRRWSLSVVHADRIRPFTKERVGPLGESGPEAKRILEGRNTGFHQPLKPAAGGPPQEYG
ncbi:4'-phosphopantetheinyl transferase [Glutamicibacter sp. ZJUTW]|uniref:4'-phosphopantetheinyl transferase family protein n=1 Tax=Glutamicibacter sp. ZJUTW TaxID=1155384 RepID=UPI0011F3DCF2|nr:4'-phosphopantetheinyl transferase superfamily protein [Glutamicibacter sp. ZJUTW]QEP06765.1 4'-phosphopantetheinyl transferase superfamily protein [Glutamicibacter sp. ZJUTW]